MRSIVRLMGMALMSALVVTTPAAAQEPDARARTEARERFTRALELYEEGQFRAALAEFQRAYDVAPAYQVLYNLGQVHAQLGDAVRATDAFEQYLREGGDEVPGERRTEVEAELARQRARIARVMVRTNVPGSTIVVDGSDVATTPLAEPLRLSAGEHVVGARAPGHDAASRRLQLAGGVLETLELELHEMAEERGALRVRSDVPGVEVRIDGEVVGTTPLDGTISVEPGRHVVEASRPGYQAVRETVEVENAAEAVVRLELPIDPEARPDELGRLRLRVPNAAFTLRVDAREVDAPSGSIELPAGEHDVVLEVAEREPVRQTVVVPPQGSVDLAPELVWAPAARQDRIDAAASQRFWGWMMAVGGTVVAGVATGVLLWNEGRTDELEANIAFFEACRGTVDNPSDCDATEVTVAKDRAEHLNQSIPLVRQGSLIALGIGAAVLGTGIVLVVLAPSEGDIDAEARADRLRIRLQAGLGSIGVTGAF